MPVTASVSARADLEERGCRQIDYRACFLLLMWDEERVASAATTGDLFAALRDMATAASKAPALDGAKLLVLGALANRYLQAPNDVKALRAHLRGDKAFAPPNAENQILPYTPANIVQAIDEGKLCGGAGYGALLQSEQMARLKEDQSLAVGIRNLDEGVDKRLWSAAELFGGIRRVLLSVGAAKENAYHVPGEAATGLTYDRHDRRQRPPPQTPATGAGGWTAALPTLLKFLEMNWSRMVQLELEQERKDELITSLRGSPDGSEGQSWQGGSGATTFPENLEARSRKLHIWHQGSVYEWFNVDEAGDIVSSDDVRGTLRENICHFFNVPEAYQALSDRDGPLRTAADLRRALRVARPEIFVEDVRTMTPRSAGRELDGARGAADCLQQKLSRADGVLEQLQRGQEEGLPSCQIAPAEDEEEEEEEEDEEGEMEVQREVVAQDPAAACRPRTFGTPTPSSIGRRGPGVGRGWRRPDMQVSVEREFGLGVPSSPSSEPVSAVSAGGRRGRRLLRVECGGQTFDWLDLESRPDLPQAENLDTILRENIAHYFGVPYECQLIFDDYGPVRTVADFTRVLESVSPLLKVYDRRRDRPPELTSEEAASDRTAEAVFNVIDTNGDGVISYPEWDKAVLSLTSSLRSGALGGGSPGAGLGLPGGGLGFGSPGGGLGGTCNGGGGVSPVREAEVEVMLWKDPGCIHFGFYIEPCWSGTALTICDLLPEGCLARWNRTNPRLALQEGDILRSVNDVTGDADAMRHLLLASEGVRLRGLRQPRM